MSLAMFWNGVQIFTIDGTSQPPLKMILPDPIMVWSVSFEVGVGLVQEQNAGLPIGITARHLPR